MLVALLKVMELTCPEKLEPSAEISPGTWLGLGQQKEAGFVVGSAIPSSLTGTWPGHVQASLCHHHQLVGTAVSWCWG